MAKVQNQETLFDVDDLTRAGQEYKGMPEFSHDDLGAFHSIKVNFRSLEDIKKFSELIGQKLTSRTRSVWYPQAAIGRYADKRYI